MTSSLNGIFLETITSLKRVIDVMVAEDIVTRSNMEEFVAETNTSFRKSCIQGTLDAQPGITEEELLGNEEYIEFLDGVEEFISEYTVKALLT